MQVVFGGAGAQGPLGDLWVFDLTSRQWSQPATQGDPPAPREMHTGTMLDDTRMLIYGGRGPDGKVTCSPTLTSVVRRQSQKQQTYRHSTAGHPHMAIHTGY